MEDINILIGANGAGKTNLISLFSFLGRLSQGKLQQYVKTEGGADSFFHFGTRNTERIKLGLEIGNNEYNVEFLPDLDNDSLFFDVESCRRVYPLGGTNWYLRSKKGESGFVTENLTEQAVKYYTLSYGDEPLILDQPEDDLDNLLIYDLIVTQLRNMKRNRQIIVVTHNANIVVNGDSELVVALAPHYGETKKDCNGSLQEKKVRETICAIMEGGSKAFEDRYRRIAPGKDHV